MRAVVTRVASASVQVDGVTVGAIERGFLILLGVGPRDGEAQCKALADKILGLRVFEDEKGKMNLGLEQVGGQVLVVSQFTLYGNCQLHGGCAAGAGGGHVRGLPGAVPGGGIPAPAWNFWRAYGGGLRQ